MANDSDEQQQRLLQKLAGDVRGAAGSGEPTVDKDDDIRAKFPDPDSDPRLRPTAGYELPPVPDVTFSRPAPTAATGASVAGRTGSGRATADDTAAGYRDMGIASTVGFSLVIAIGVGAGFGWLVDRYLLHSTATPWGMLIGLLIGVVSGFYNLIRVTNRLNR
jgi:F0F1-type ATP synthase assembly protein I